MKRTVFVILILSLAMGIPLMVFDFLYRGESEFRVPEDMEQLVVDLDSADRTEELLLERDLIMPSMVELFMQSDTEGLKRLKLVSEGELLGRREPRVDFFIQRYTGPQAAFVSLMLAPGKYAIYLNSQREAGQLTIGYRETPMEPAEFERLFKIHRGDLSNPPVGYREVYSADLADLDMQEEVIYSISQSSGQDLGLAIYTSATQGTVSVDFVGSTSSFLGLVNTEHRICDQLVLSLSPGEYQVRLTCQDADGQLYVFLKEAR